MTARRAIVAGILMVASATATHVQQPEPPFTRPEKPRTSRRSASRISALIPAGFPGTPGSLAVANAAAPRYWVFRGIAYRGSHRAARARVGQPRAL